MAMALPWPRQWQRKRQRQQGPSEATGEDRLSALPDDILVAILQCLDTRTALSTAILAQRWAHLPRRLRSLDLMVSDILPRAANMSVRARTVLSPYVRVAVGWHVRHRTMIRYINGIKSLVDADAGTGVEQRCVKRLQLEFFVPDDPDNMNRLINTVVASWGVEDLKVVVKPMHPPSDELLVCEEGFVTFLCLSLAMESKQRIRKLTLGGFCDVQRLYDFGKLTELVLQDIVRPLPTDAYENIFSSCPQLQSVHLRRCCTKAVDHGGIGISMMEVDARVSMVRELIIDSCTFYGVKFNSLPLLEHLACSGNPVMLMFEQVPRITHLNLSFAITNDDEYDDDYTMYDLMGGNPSMTDLVARFTGIQRWITKGITGLTIFYALRRLLVADVPSTWDVSWPRLILESAPSLQVFHMNIVEDTAADTDAMAPAMQREHISWEPSTNFQQRRLEEMVLVGFHGTTTRWAFFVRYVMNSCTALQRVVLVKSGRVDVRGLWGGWEVVVAPPPDQGPWSDDEKVETIREIDGGNKLAHFGGQVIFE